MMEDEQDKEIYDQLDALQNALKLCANGLYGQLASKTSELTCKPGGEAITTFGKKFAVEVGDRLLTEPKFAHMKLEIIYGDTDSLFIKMGAYSGEMECKPFFSDEEWTELQRHLLEIVTIEGFLQYVPDKVKLASFPDQYLLANFKKQKFKDPIIIKDNVIGRDDLRRLLYRCSYENQLFDVVFDPTGDYKLLDAENKLNRFTSRESAMEHCEDIDYINLIINRYVSLQATCRDFPKIVEWVNVESGILTGVMKMGFEDIAFIMLNGKKKYFKLLASKARGDCISSKMKIVGMTNRSMTPYYADLAKSLAKKIMIYNHDIQPAIREAMQKVASNLVPYKLLKHSSNLSKPIEDYDKNGRIGSERHVVAARQLRDAGKEVIVGDRITYYYCLVNGLKDNLKSRKMGSQTIAAAFKKDYDLDLRVYVNEMLKSLEMFSSALPDVPRKLFPINSFSFSILRTKEMPGVAGPLDSFVVKNEKKRSLERSGASKVVPVKRQATLFETMKGVKVVPACDRTEKSNRQTTLYDKFVRKA